MSHIQKSAILPYNSQQLYDIVNDVAHYPDFLPWCLESHVLSQDADHMRASLTIGRGVLNRTFVTENQLSAPHRIEMHLVDGPFQKLEGVWTFTDRDDGHCLVEFVLDFIFNKPKNALLFGPIFKKAANTLVDSFLARAKDVYGN